jgi:hypothetical protein
MGKSSSSSLPPKLAPRAQLHRLLHAEFITIYKLDDPHESGCMLKTGMNPSAILLHVNFQGT